MSSKVQPSPTKKAPPAQAAKVAKSPATGSSNGNNGKKASPKRSGENNVARLPASSTPAPVAYVKPRKPHNQMLDYERFIEFLMHSIPEVSWWRCSLVIRFRTGPAVVSEGKYIARDATKVWAQKFAKIVSRVTLLVENRSCEPVREESFPFVAPFTKDQVRMALASDLFDTMKRKDPPPPPPLVFKKPRVTENMRITHRKDVPDDVKELVTLVRRKAYKNIRSEKQRAARLKSSLDMAKAKAEATNRIWRENLEKELAKAKAKIKPESQPVPPQATAPPEPKPEPKPKPPPPVDKSFDEWFEELEVFKLRNGHCRVPIRLPGLGTWVGRIRASYKWYTPDEPPFLDGEIPGPYFLIPERVERLEKIGFEWRAAPPAVPFEKRMEAMRRFKEKHGHCDVPRMSYKEDPSLGEWVHVVRRQYKHKNGLPQDRVEQLEALGFKWQVRTNLLSFEERLEECRNFRQKHGHLTIPPISAKSKEAKTLPAEEKSLRRWAMNQRTFYAKFLRGEKSPMDKQRIKKLQDIGFDFTIPDGFGTVGRARNEEAFNKQFEKLKDIKARFGDVNSLAILREACPGDTSLLNWVFCQRKAWRNMKKGKKWNVLTEDRRLRLESLGFDFQPNAAAYASRSSIKASDNEADEEEEDDDSSSEENGQAYAGMASW